MEKGFGWDYPAGADIPEAPWNEKDHLSGCPESDEYELTDDQDPADLECECDQIRRDAALNKAQAKIDAWKQRGLDV